MTCATKQFNIVKKILNNSILSQNLIELILIEYWNFLPKQMNLLNWININDLDWSSLSQNINATQLLQQNQDKIDWDNLSFNENAIHLLEQNINRVNWGNLSENINAIPILKNNKDKINWKNISKNPSIFEIEHMPII